MLLLQVDCGTGREKVKICCRMGERFSHEHPFLTTIMSNNRCYSHAQIRTLLCSKSPQENQKKVNRKKQIILPSNRNRFPIEFKSQNSESSQLRLKYIYTFYVSSSEFWCFLRRRNYNRKSEFKLNFAHHWNENKNIYRRSSLDLFPIHFSRIVCW